MTLLLFYYDEQSSYSISAWTVCVITSSCSCWEISLHPSQLYYAAYESTNFYTIWFNKFHLFIHRKDNDTDKQLRFHYPIRLHTSTPQVSSHHTTSFVNKNKTHISSQKYVILYNTIIMFPLQISSYFLIYTTVINLIKIINPWTL